METASFFYLELQDRESGCDSTSSLEASEGPAAGSSGIITRWTLWIRTTYLLRPVCAKMPLFSWSTIQAVCHDDEANLCPSCRFGIGFCLCYPRRYVASLFFREIDEWRNESDCWTNAEMDLERDLKLTVGRVCVDFAFRLMWVDVTTAFSAARMRTEHKLAWSRCSRT